MNEEAKNKLWEDYMKTKSSALREKIIIEYSPLVKIVAGRLSMYLGYNVEYDDLVGYGVFGLIDAIDKFDYLKGIKFETYASLRIRGAILDHIRKMDWIPRTLRQKQKRIDMAYNKLEAETGKAVTNKELAEELDISIEELESWQNQTKVSNIISLDEYLEQGSETKVEISTGVYFDEPEKAIERQEMKKALIDALKVLTEKEEKVIVLYYYEELTLKEISMILEVSESRVSQLHTRALQKMKQKLGEDIDMFYGI